MKFEFPCKFTPPYPPPPSYNPYAMEAMKFDDLTKAGYRLNLITFTYSK